MKKALGKRIKEGIIETTLFLSALSSVFITISIVAVLAYESFGFFKEVPLIEFLTGKEWTPLFAEPKFGILPLISGTLLNYIHSAHSCAAIRD